MDRSGKRVRLIREISDIVRELENPLAGQFVAFASKSNESGDLGGLSKNFPNPVTSFTPLRQSGIVSINFENGRIQNHSSPIRSLKGGLFDYLGSLGILLEDGTFLAGGGSPDERKGRGNLKKFANLSNAKIKKISAGYEHFLMLSKSGEVFSMLAKGGGNYGQLGTGDTQSHFEPVKITGIPKIRKIRAGWHASSLVDDSGNPWVCGTGGYGGKFPFKNEFKKPTKVASGVRNVFWGFSSATVFIQQTDGKILAGGSNWDG